MSFCVFTFLRLKVFSIFTLHKKFVERFWGYRVLERIKTHRLSTKPALYDPQTYEFFRFYEKRPFRIFDVYPSYFDRIPEFFWPNFRARQRATFMFLIHFWPSWKTYFKNALKHLQKCFKHITKWEKGLLFHNKVKKRLKKGQRVKTPKTKSPTKTIKETLVTF